MVEPEVAFNDSDANMRLQESFVTYIVARALERSREELEELERDVARWSGSPRHFRGSPTPMPSRSSTSSAPTSPGAPTSAATMNAPREGVRSAGLRLQLPRQVKAST